MKEIELENFKSFGRRFRLPFLPGYTAITGPNGSGKSNLSDAVLFVLGPKSSKVIRAGKLTDLVYNGGKDGNPANHCRVSLVFDNKSRTIPLDSDEVRLTRYVGLSPSVEDGYNSYFYINGRKATLSAFDSLLANAKISAEGYNIVQQGDVGRIVEMSPVERRRVLEDIAGISQFDEDIRRAEEKKAGVEENLGRIEIILDEIKRQLRQLEKDREAALRYRELKEKLETARAQQAHKEAHVLQQQLASTHKQVEKYQADGERLKGECDRLRNALEDAEGKLRDLEEEVAQMGGEEFKELKERLDGLRIERARAQDGIERNKEEVKELRTEASAGKKEFEKLLKEIAELKAQQRGAEEATRQVETSIGSLDEEIAGLEEKASQSDEKILQVQKALVSLDKEIENLETRHKSLSLEREKLVHGLEQLDEQIAQLEEERKAQEFEVQDGEWQLKEATSSSKATSKELKGLEGRHEELVAEEKELNQQSSELESAVRTLSREYSQLKAEADAADSVRKGYNRAVSTILEARDTGKLGGIHGTIAELAQVRPEHDIALKVAAGARMQAIVVEDDGIASDAIEYLKSRKMGRAIFLPLNKMLPGRPRGKALLAVREALGFAIDLVSFDEKYRHAFWYVFGDTVVVEDLAQARRLMGGIRLVTLDGQLVEASGAMVGGQVEEVLLKFGQVSEGRLRETGEKLRKASEELKNVNERLQEVRGEVRQMDKALRELRGQEDRRGSMSEVLRKRVAELKDRLKASNAALERKRDKRQGAKECVESLEAGIGELEGQIKEIRQKRDTKREELAQATPQRIAQRMRKLQSEKLSQVGKLNAHKSQAGTLGSQISLQEGRRSEVEERQAEIRDRIAQQEKRTAGLVEKLAQVEDELLGLQKMEERLLAEMKGVRERRDAAFKARTELEAKLEKLGSKLETTEDFLLSLEAQSTSLRERLAEAEAHLKEFGDVGEELPPLEDIKATITRCEKALDSIGAVNLRALEDYETQEVRHDELKEELSRLKKERQNLLRLVGELETRKRDGLLTVFRAIRENFVAIFGELSEGGEAELHMESEEDPFSGGLIIKARPPDKRFLRLEALSGGEKSLVSMAFIFAIQEYEPSPFYFLDEVDQNLDAVNAERIARMIRKNSATAQFIQISLRKVSLKEADHILGVTMRKKGISDVVMRVNLDEVTDEVPKAEAAA